MPSLGKMRQELITRIDTERTVRFNQTVSERFMAVLKEYQFVWWLNFRNYLEFVAGTIYEWIQQQEAGYQAALLAAEVEKLRNEELSPSQHLADDKDGKSRQRSKSPKKSDKYEMSLIIFSINSIK